MSAAQGRVTARSCRICGARFDAPMGGDAVRLATEDLALHMDGHTRDQIVRVYALGEPWWKAMEVVESSREANRPGDATNAPGHDTEEVTSMPDKRIPIAEQFRPIIAQGFAEGWTTGDLRDAFEQVVEMENEARMQAVAALTYGPKTTKTTPDAASIVATAKLPPGHYGIAGPTDPGVQHIGSAFDAVAAALASDTDMRLYRRADGWRFVGIIQHDDGHFVDERAS